MINRGGAIGNRYLVARGFPILFGSKEGCGKIMLFCEKFLRSENYKRLS